MSKQRRCADSPATRERDELTDRCFLLGPRNKLYPNRDGIEGVMGAEPADGEVECKKAVRRQVGAGADWIKVTFLRLLTGVLRFGLTDALSGLRR